MPGKHTWQANTLPLTVFVLGAACTELALTGSRSRLCPPHPGIGAASARSRVGVHGLVNQEIAKPSESGGKALQPMSRMVHTNTGLMLKSVEMKMFCGR